MRRYYALVMENDGYARLIKVNMTRTVLAEVPIAWEPDRTYRLELSVDGNAIRSAINGRLRLAATDSGATLLGGAVGLVIEEGTLIGGPVTVTPVES